MDLHRQRRSVHTVVDLAVWNIMQQLGSSPIAEQSHFQPRMQAVQLDKLLKYACAFHPALPCRRVRTIH